MPGPERQPHSLNLRLVAEYEGAPQPAEVEAEAAVKVTIEAVVQEHWEERMRGGRRGWDTFSRHLGVSSLPY